jgi:hypothetical protein
MLPGRIYHPVISGAEHGVKAFPVKLGQLGVKVIQGGIQGGGLGGGGLGFLIGGHFGCKFHDFSPLL